MQVLSARHESNQRQCNSEGRRGEAESLAPSQRAPLHQLALWLLAWGMLPDLMTPLSQTLTLHWTPPRQSSAQK